MRSVLKMIREIWSKVIPWVGPWLLMGLGVIVLVLGIAGAGIGSAGVGLLCGALGYGNLRITQSRKKQEKQQGGRP